MTGSDLAAVEHIAAAVHPGHPEDAAVFAERFQLYPDGCLILSAGGAAAGYLISHPWPAERPPKLNQLLGEIPPEADTYYIHDIALLASARGAQAAAGAVHQIIAHARREGFSRLSLVAVNDSANFWRRLGFSDRAPQPDLTSYGGGARLMVRASAP